MPLYQIHEPPRQNQVAAGIAAFLLARRQKKQQQMEEQKLGMQERQLGIEEQLAQAKLAEATTPAYTQELVGPDNQFGVPGQSLIQRNQRTGQMAILNRGGLSNSDLVRMIQEAAQDHLIYNSPETKSRLDFLRGQLRQRIGEMVPKGETESPGVEQALTEEPQPQVAAPSVPPAEGALMPTTGNESAPPDELARALETLRAETASTQLPRTPPPSGGPTSRELPPSEWRMGPVDPNTASQFDTLSRTMGDAPPDGFDRQTWAKLGANKELKAKIRQAMSILRSEGQSKEEAARTILGLQEVQEALNSGGK